MLQYQEINLKISRWIHLAGSKWFLIAHLISTWYMMTSSNGNIFCVTAIWSPVNSPHKGQWRGALMFSLICVWITGWANNRQAGDLRRHSAHYDVIVMNWIQTWSWVSPPKHENGVGILYKCIFFYLLDILTVTACSYRVPALIFLLSCFVWGQGDWNAVIFTIWMPKFATSMV